MIRFFGQPKYHHLQPTELVGYELLLREWQSGHWVVPTDFHRYSSQEITRLLQQTLPALPATLALTSFNLNQTQFVDPHFLAALVDLAKMLPHPEHLMVELTEHDEHVSAAELVAAAQRYANAGLRLCLDDVSTGANQPPLAKRLSPYLSEYKFALQNFRAGDDARDPMPLLRQWHDRAVQEGKLFAIEGFEETADLDIAVQYQPDVLQGYYFGRPALLPLQTAG